MDTTNEINIMAPDKIFRRTALEWLLVPFVIGLMTLSNIEGLSKIMIVYGLAFSWLFLIYFLYLKLKLQPEVILYFAWIAWSIIGAFKAVDMTLYLPSLITIIQIGAMIFVVAGVIAQRPNVSIVMLAVAIGGIIVAISGYYSGEYQLASEIESRTRATGLTGNANNFAYHLLFVIFVLFYFWQFKCSLGRHTILLAVITICFIGIIYSGSRKGFVCVLTFLLLWFLYCHGKKAFEKPIITFVILLILSGALYFTTDYVLSNTFLGKRLELDALEHGSEPRIQMYLDGFAMIGKNPIWGVGLNNYRLLSISGLYSHSDYIEVAANTGIVGFCLYFSIYVVLWRRLNRIKTMTEDPRLMYIIGLFKAAIITILLAAFGSPHITSKLTWVFLASAIGYSWSIERALLLKLPGSEWTSTADSKCKISAA